MVACNPLYLDMEQCSEQVVTNWFLKQCSIFNGILDSKIFIFPFLHDTIWFLFVIDTSAKDFYFFRGVEHKHLECHSNIIRPYFERLKILLTCDDLIEDNDVMTPSITSLALLDLIFFPSALSYFVLLIIHVSFILIFV